MRNPPRRHGKTHRHESAMIDREGIALQSVCAGTQQKSPHRGAGVPAITGTIAPVMPCRCCPANPIL
ncbi:hypothetical protein [Kamptonema formosum]|uniref:hypothetical protein n=1 Tax=Kamptonema formosum TaxID=331992 RepID=UPI0018E289A9|nr:hypothetical protein [Oscillatoria sp. PCC 10802]